MTVSDNGVGFPGNLSNENSLGINLVSTLARQIYGSVEVNDNKGVEFIIKFPKNI